MWTREQVMEQVKKLYPKQAKSPAWLAGFVQFLLTQAPAFLAWIMSIVPKPPAPTPTPTPTPGPPPIPASDPHAFALAACAAAFDCTPEAPKLMQGVIFDAQIHAALNEAKAIAEKAGASALDYAQKVIENYVSPLLP